MTWTCGTCHRDFVSVRAREQHMDALGHSQPTHECDTCSKYFGNRAAVVQHMNASNHWMYDCPLCDETWPSKDKVDKHVIEYHHHCKDCDRTFGDYNRIKMVSVSVRLPSSIFARIPAVHPSSLLKFADRSVAASQLAHPSPKRDGVSVLQAGLRQRHGALAPPGERLLSEGPVPGPRHGVQARAVQGPQRHRLEEADRLARLV